MDPAEIRDTKRPAFELPDALAVHCEGVGPNGVAYGDRILEVIFSGRFINVTDVEFDNLEIAPTKNREKIERTPKRVCAERFTGFGQYPGFYPREYVAVFETKGTLVLLARTNRRGGVGVGSKWSDYAWKNVAVVVLRAVDKNKKMAQKAEFRKIVLEL